MPVETTEPFGRDVYNRLSDVRNQVRTQELKLFMRAGTEPINDDDIRASIEAVMSPAQSAFSLGQKYHQAIELLAAWTPTELTGFKEWYHRKAAPDSYWKDLYSKLGMFRNLKKGWDGYSAPRPSADAILNAKEFLDVLSLAKLKPSRFKPSVVGGVGITFRHGNRKAYIEFYNDGRVHSLLSDGTTEPKTKRIKPSYQRYLQLIRDIRKYLNA